MLRVCVVHYNVNDVYEFVYANKYQMGDAVTQLVEALRYKLEGSGFDPQWCHWNISLT